MGQKANERRVGQNEAMAMVKNLKTSPQKLNLVAQTIRGKDAGTALVDLEFNHRRISEDVRKCLQSAVANAENNHGLDVDKLYVAEAYVGKSLTMKRWRARARGRAAKILKPFSRITIVVRERDAEGKATVSQKASPKKAAKPEKKVDVTKSAPKKAAAKKTTAKKAPAKKAAAKKTTAKKAPVKGAQAAPKKDTK
ncbi:MAG: 50S ribosomal protein L22 [Micavibrio sp.]|nr:50S ribosomal protein L22 [Micavibrio sp.]